jgi:hypothetical protein
MQICMEESLVRKGKTKVGREYYGVQQTDSVRVFQAINCKYLGED